MSHVEASTTMREYAADGGALEIVIGWGDSSLLHVAHLSPVRSFYLGELAGPEAPASDFPLDTHALGVPRLPLVLEDAGHALLVIPAQGALSVQRAGQVLGLPELEQEGVLAAAADLAAARCYRLAPHESARIAYLGLVFFVRYTEPAAPLPRLEPRALFRQNLWQLASFSMHGLLLGAFYCLPPTAAALSLDRLDPGSRFIQYQLTPPEVPPPESLPSWLRSVADGGSQGAAAAGEQGAMGEPKEVTRRQRAQRGQSDLVTPALAPDPSSARNAGILGILKSSRPALPSLFQRDNAEGRDPVDAIGALIADQLGTGTGFGGLAMNGTGRGGNGRADGTIGSGTLGTMGIGGGEHGPGRGYGEAGGGSWRQHTTRVPKVRVSNADVVGSLSKETIRRVIGRHLNEVRYCYEQRLLSRPELQGRVTVRFMISRDGGVAASALLDSDVGDAQVGSCINDAVKRWVFPAPEGGGVVGVTYPFLLTQTGQ